MEKEKIINSFDDLTSLNNSLMKTQYVSELISTLNTRNNFYETLKPLINRFDKSIVSIMNKSDFTASLFNESQIDSFTKIINDNLKLFNKTISKIREYKPEDSYILAFDVLTESNWPYFLYVNDENVKDINSFRNLETSNINENRVSEYITERCDESFLDKILKTWESYPLMNISRFELFTQGIECYKDKKYAACVSLFMCNFDGVISDMYEYLKTTSNIKLDKENSLGFYKYYHPNDTSSDDNIIKKLNPKNDRIKDKDKLIITYAMFEDDNVVWMIIFEYLLNEILTSKKVYNTSIPCRNKICHGEQLNYNTKEYALKSILIMDLLISFYQKVYKVVDKKDSTN